MVQWHKVHEESSVVLMHLETDWASLIVTESHRIMVPRGERNSPEPMLAKCLRRGDTVVTNHGCQRLKKAEPMQCWTAVVEIGFDPDGELEVFHPDGILNKGRRPNKKLCRRGRSLRRNIPDTDDSDEEQRQRRQGQRHQ